MIKLNKGTWHAGPFFRVSFIINELNLKKIKAHTQTCFQEEHMDFLNFELCETNISDHNSHDYAHEKMKFVIKV
jgi:hypothetical protein